MLPTKISSAVAVIEVDGLPQHNTEKHRYSVKLALNGLKRETKGSQRGNSPHWNEAFDFSIPTDMSSILSFSVFVRHTIMKATFLGRIHESVASLLAKRGQEVSQVLSGLDGQPSNTPCSLKFRLEVKEQSDKDTVADLISGPSEDLKRLHRILPSKSAEKGVEIASEAVDLAQSTTDYWEPLLKSVKLFTEIADRIAEVHPYAKMAWDVLSFAHKMVIAQVARDQSMDELLQSMTDAYKFVHNDDTLRDIEPLTDDVNNKNLPKAKRIAQGVFSNVDEDIKQYITSFEELYRVFNRQATVQTTITVRRVLGTVQDIAVAVDLIDMTYANARFQIERVCLPHTRQGLLDEIFSWANNATNEEHPRIFLLTGVAGSGKSSISHTVARQFNELKRLGSSFFFNRERDETRRPDNVFSTIARDLADLDIHIKDQLWKAIGNNRSLRLTRSVREQFENFVLKPTSDLKTRQTNGPIVIVMDALDECGDPQWRETLLEIIADKIPELPSNFRFLITSRPEDDIMSALADKPFVMHRKMSDIGRQSTDADISVFVHHQLSRVFSDPVWPPSRWQAPLVQHAEGLFIWASTACLFVKGTGKAGGVDPTERLEIVISDHPKSEKMPHMLKLYLTILQNIFDENDSLIMNRFRIVLGRILVAMTPLSIDSLNDLHDTDDPKQSFDVNLVTRHMGALLDGVKTPNIPLRMLHTSFRDFLTDQGLSGIFYVDISSQSGALIAPCLKIMSESLIGSLRSMENAMARRNDNMHCFSADEAMSPTLQYACRFWIRHLLDIQSPSDQLLTTVQTFFTRYSLHCVEALSRLGKLQSDRRLIDDCWEWLQRFRSWDAAAKAAFHMTITAIPAFWLPESPTDSDQGDNTQRTRILANLKGDINHVSYMACSPYTSTIVTGTDDGMVQMWELETGAPIGKATKAHIGPVLSVAFSPNMRHAATGSSDGTLQIWDVGSGHYLSDGLQGHTGAINSIAFSPNGKRVLSASTDSTIRFWDSESGSSIGGPLEGHTGIVTSVVFSPDGCLAASASEDRTIRVWDPEAGVIVSGPVVGHSGAVNSIIFSPDGHLLMSSSDDKTVRMWDSRTGFIVAVFEEHSKEVVSTVFSADGRLAASKARDGTVLVFDVRTLQIVGEPVKIL
ncbi:WD40 repeat-like protein [Rickenella mellea]|uniref:WD40 repeat-like protein n=1 Tax=Rickenella mellea TaxID=50990 RepID=A0A4Y7PTT9_9AGAM|nr:WD40 repeat-like protein [Rickenella mellea]